MYTPPPPDSYSFARHENKKRWALVSIVCLIYLPTLLYRFVNYDDPVNTEQNPFFNPLTLTNVLRVWYTPHVDLYIPLTYSVWAILAWLGYRGPKVIPGTGESVLQLSPVYFHAANTLVFLGAVLLVHRVLALLLAVGQGKEESQRDRRSWGAWAGAVCFAVHPLQVESVAWVTSLKGTLSGFFCLGAFYAYLRFRATEETEDGFRPPASGEPEAPPLLNGFYAGALVLFVLALLAKPTAVMLPLWFVAVDYWLFREAPRSIARELWPFFLLALLLGALSPAVYRSLPYSELALWERGIVAFDALSGYLAKVVFPWPLSIEYGRLPEMVLATPWTAVTVSAPFALAFLVCQEFRRGKDPWLVIAFSLFVLNLVPVLGLKPHEMQVVTNVCDRYVFLSLLGPAIVVSWLVSARIERKWWMGTLALVGTLWLGGSLWQRGVWRDDFSLYTHVLSLRPESGRALRNLAAAYEERLDYRNAASYYQRAHSIEPRAETVNSLGTMYLHLRLVAEAERAFADAARLNPADPHYPYNRSVALLLQRRVEEARAAYAVATTLARKLGQAPLAPPRGLAEEGGPRPIDPARSRREPSP